jgi:hypothetical protein
MNRRWNNLENYQTDALLLDAHSPNGLGGTGKKFNWDLAVAAQRFGKPIFLAGGLTPENVATQCGKVRPFGVDVSSGVESAPGKKDPAKMKAFIVLQNRSNEFRFHRCGSNSMKRITVYCGSNSGTRPEYTRAAEATWDPSGARKD